MIVYVESSFIDLLLWGFIFSLIAAIAIGAGWLLWWFALTPTEARSLRKASRQKRPWTILQGDDGYTDAKVGYRQGPEGILEMYPEGKGKTKRVWTGLVARKVEHAPREMLKAEAADPPGDVAGSTQLSTVDAEGKEKTIKLIEFLNDLATQPTVFRGAKIPILVGYRGKVVLTRIAHIVGLMGIEALWNTFPNLFVNVDLAQIKTLFPMPWDETQLDNQAQIKYREGFYDGKKQADQSKPLIYVILAMAVMFGLAALCLIIIKFL